MIRRTVALSLALVCAGAFGTSAFASQQDGSDDGRHSICVGTSDNPSSVYGLCVWVPEVK